MLSDLAEQFEPYSIVAPASDAPLLYERAELVMWAEDALGWNIVFDEPGPDAPVMPGRLTGVFIPNLPVFDRGAVLREIVPAEGDQIVLWGVRTGERIDLHGIGVNEDVVYYHDFAQRMARAQRATENAVARRRRMLYLLGDEMAAQYAQLPPLLRIRIDTLRSERPDFTENGEREELLMLADAVKLANYCTARAMNEHDRAINPDAISSAALEWFGLVARAQQLDDMAFKGVVSRHYRPEEAGPMFSCARALLQQRSVEQTPSTS